MTKPRRRNTRMPKRPPQHALRDQAVLAFRAALPPEWQFRETETSQDYGVDGIVEIFLDGEATGLEFRVQIKGVEKATGRRKAASVKWSTYEYWRAQVDQVLVVLWEKVSGNIWWQWAHRFDPWGFDTSKKTFRFPFPTDQTWSGETPDQLLSEVRSHRAWLHPQSALPLQVSISGVGDIGSLPGNLLRGKLRRRLGAHPRVLEVRDDSSGSLSISISASDAEVRIKLNGGGSFVIHDARHVDESDPDTDSLADHQVSDIVAGLAIRLGTTNLRSEAGRLLEDCVDSGCLVVSEKGVVPAIELLLESGKVDAFLRLIQRLLSENHPGAIHAMAYIGTTHHLATIDQDQLRNALRELIDRHEAETNDHGQTAIVASNAARLLSQFQPEMSLWFFDKAALLDSAFTRRPYWWKERAGALFRVGAYPEAVDNYQRAIDLGAEDARPHLADSLLMAGRYQGALDLFGQLLDDGRLDDPEWVLKGYVLEFLVNEIGITAQERDEDAAHDRMEPDSVQLGESDFLEALKFDLLCPQALSGVARTTTDSEQSAKYWIAAAAMAAHDAELWLMALTSAIHAQDPMSLEVAYLARRHGGGEIITLLEEDGAPAEVIAATQTLFDEMPPEPMRPFQVRLVPPGSSEYEVIEFSDDDASDVTSEDGADDNQIG